METVKYTMVVHAAEEGGFWAEFPELPGCLTQGASLEEVRAHAQEAVSLYVEELKAQGKETPSGIVLVEAVETRVA